MAGWALLGMGDVDVSLSLNPLVSAEGISLANAEWGTEQPMLDIGRASFRISLWDLILGDIVLPEVSISSPKIILEKSADGKRNWDLKKPEEEVEPPKIGRLAIENGKLGEWAITDAIAYPKDPGNVVLEQNDVAFHFKSDYNDHLSEVMRALFHPGSQTLNGIPADGVYVGDLFTITSIRRGFAGRGMPRVMAERLQIAGAEKVPPGAMLFMGFTSSHVHGLAQGTLPSFETIPGYTDQTPESYFANGTMMHLSHIQIDLEGWYKLDHPGRLQRMFHARRTESQEILSPSQAPETSTFKEQLEDDAKVHKLLGHNAQMQFLSRVDKDTRTVYGERIPKGTVIFLRQDFDTVENPFEFDAAGPVNPAPKAGVHFIGFAPSAQLFDKIRKEMDGVELQKKYNLPDENTGFTKFLVTTHRQHYLEPPRIHRSFPLAEKS